jgi:hypothetical protein
VGTDWGTEAALMLRRPQQRNPGLIQENPVSQARYGIFCLLAITNQRRVASQQRMHAELLPYKGRESERGELKAEEPGRFRPGSMCASKGEFFTAFCLRGLHVV